MPANSRWGLFGVYSVKLQYAVLRPKIRIFGAPVVNVTIRTSNQIDETI